MEPSSFNSLVDVDDQIHLAFNHTHGRLIRASAPVARYLRREPGAELDQPTLAKLAARGFVVESPSRELDYVGHNLASFRHGRPVVNVSVVLTYACNMRCPYCYETASHPKETTLTPEMAHQLVLDIQRRVDEIGARGVALTLYGGEPMVNRKVARQLVDELRAYVTEKKLSFETILISNGTLITPEAIAELRFGLRFVQLTLEGSPAYHDTVRIGPSGQGTFHRILESARTILAAGVGVQWRIQVSPKDWRSLGECFAALDAAGVLHHPNVRLYFFPILDIQSVCSAKSFACYEEYFSAEMLEHFWQLATTYRTNLFRLPRPVWDSPYCSFVNANTWVVDPSGRKFKCVAEIGHDDAVCGTIGPALPGAERSRARSRELRVLGRTGMDFAECRQCEYLPSCDAGCGFRAAASTGSWSNRCCEMHKGVVPHQIAYYYKYLQQAGEAGRVEQV